MGKKNSSRRSRNVYDPTIAVTDVDRLEKTNLFAERDPLALGISPEMEDIRSQSDIRDARFHNDDRSTRIRWKYILPIAILGLIAIIATAATAGKKGGSNNSSSSQSEEVKFLPAPSEEALSQACNPSVVQTADGLQKCQDMCQPSDCCKFPSNMPMSCLFGNERMCQEYHRYCYILSKGTQQMSSTPSFPPATQEVYEACSGENLETVDGHNECVRACEPAQCCYRTGEEGSCSTESKCLGYAPCLALRAKTHQHDDIARLVGTKCSDDNIKTTKGTLECESVCSQSLCCFVENDVCGALDDYSFCDQYVQCKDIVLKGLNPDGDNKIILNLPSDELAKVCSLNNIMTDFGRAECEDMCEVSDCCNTGACIDDNIDACSQYQRQCSNLYLEEPNGDAVGSDPNGNKIILDPPSGELAKVCSLNNIKTKLGRAECEDVCEEADCCNTGACIDDNIDACSQYQRQCSNLYLEEPVGDDNKIILDPPSGDLALFCSLDNIKTNLGRIQCEDICKQADCCNTGACIDDNIDACSQYQQQCLNLYLEDPDVDNNDVPFGDQELGMPPVNIGTVCSMSNIETTLGLEQCKLICNKAVCCQADLWGEDSCYDKNAAACDAYKAACKNLDRVDDDNDSSHINPPPSTIGTICGSINVRTKVGLTECQEICSAADCCQLAIWESMYCRENNEDVCNQYDSHCSILEGYEDKNGENVGDAPYLPGPPSNLSFVCSQTNIATAIGRSNCDALCAQAACCDINFRNGGSCIESNHQTCQLYHNYCWILNPSNTDDTSEQTPATTSEPTSTKINPAPSTIKDICSFESIRTQAGHNSCWEICEPASCCWRKDVISCASGSICNGYYMCFGLNGINFDKVDEIEWESGPEDGPVGGNSNGSSNVTQEDVQEACSRIILDECEALCEPASCCAAGTCTGLRASIDCNIYRACDVLY